MMFLHEADVSVLPGNDRYPLGEVHPALVIVTAEDSESSIGECLDAVRANGFQIHRFGRSKQIADQPGGLSDEILLNAYRRAHALGFAMVVYRDPCT